MTGHSHYFIETSVHMKERVTTEEGVDTLEEARAYLTNMYLPEHVVEGAIKNLGYKDGTYNIKITLLGNSYTNWCPECRIHYLNTVCDLHPK